MVFGVSIQAQRQTEECRFLLSWILCPWGLFFEPYTPQGLYHLGYDAAVGGLPLLHRILGVAEADPQLRKAMQTAPQRNQRND